jgi:hypothetical protein
VRLERVSNVIRAKLDIEESGIRDYEFQVSFRGGVGGELAPKLSEVAEIRSLRLGELKVEMLKVPERFTPWFRGRAIDIGLFDRLQTDGNVYNRLTDGRPCGAGDCY